MTMSMTTTLNNYRVVLVLLFVLFIVAVLVDNQKSLACAFRCNADGTVFQIVLKFEWNKDRDGAFPNEDFEIQPGFKMMSCVSHNASFSLWKAGKASISQFRQFFLDAAAIAGTESAVTETDPFDTFLKTLYFENITENRLRSELGDYDHKKAEEGDDGVQKGLVFDRTIEPEGTDILNVTASPSTPYLSCFSMIWPSADWFTGISTLYLCNDTSSSRLEIPLFPFDAGVYRVDGYETGKPETREFSLEPFIRQVRVVAPRGYGTMEIKPKGSSTDQQGSASSSNKSPQGGVCFPSDETVMLSTGDSIRMDQLSIGESVRTMSITPPSSSVSSISIAQRNSSIFAFSHQNHTIMSTFTKISYRLVDDLIHLRLSPGHYLYSVPLSQSSSQSVQLSLAQFVQPGDMLIHHSAGLVPVVDVQFVRARGLFNPHSITGDLIVSGVRVSCYTQSVAPCAAQALLSPLRTLHRLGMQHLANTISELAARWWRSWRYHSLLFPKIS